MVVKEQQEQEREGESGIELARQDKAAIQWHTNKGSKAGPVMVTRVSHSLEMARKVCSDEADPRSSQETKSAGKDQQGTWLGAHIHVGTGIL